VRPRQAVCADAQGAGEHQGTVRHAPAHRRSSTTSSAGFEDLSSARTCGTVTQWRLRQRVPVSAYRSRGAGGKGRSGMATREGRFSSPICRRQHAYAGLVLPSRGIVYKLKVWRLPLGRQQARGQGFVICCRWAKARRFPPSSMPEDEAELVPAAHVMFAHGARWRAPQRAQRLRQCPPDRQIAMKFEGDDEGDRLIASASARGAGRAAGDPGWPAPCASCVTVRVFASRNSTGVRGIALAEADEVNLDVAGRRRQGHPRPTTAMPICASRVPCARPRRRRGGLRRRRRRPTRLRPAPELSPERFKELQGQGRVRAHRRLVGLSASALGLRVSGDRSRGKA